MLYLRAVDHGDVPTCVGMGSSKTYCRETSRAFNLDRSSLYYHPVPPSPEEIALKDRIDEIYTESNFNRNAILHGADTGFGTEVCSLKAISTFDTL